MDKVISIYAPLRNYTGYAEVVRNLVWRLYVLGWKINFEEFVGWANNTLVLNDEQEAFFSMLEKNKYPSDIQLSICLPEQARLEAEKVNVNLTMFEAKRRLPKLWIETSKRLDCVIVPTKQNYRLWYDNLGMPFNKLSLLPFGVNSLEVKNAATIPIVCKDEGVDICKEYKYQLLVLQEYISRKNLRGVLEAFYLGCVKNEARHKDTCLVLKLNSNSGNKLSAFKKMCYDVKEGIEVKYNTKLPNNLFVYTRTLGENMMYDFFNSFTHYFSMTNGEGWDLNCMKSVALGKTAIVPKSSSYLEYLDDDKCHFIKCREGKFRIEENNLIRLYKDSLWDCPDVEVAANYIADIDIIGERDCSEHILTNFSWDKCAAKFDEILSSLCINEKSTKKDRAYCGGRTTLMVCQTIGKQCGIGEYTTTLHKALDEVDSSVITVSSDVYNLLSKVEEFCPNVVHIQNEYQFYTPKRLKYVVNKLKEKNIKTVLTQHTFNEDVYTLNKIFVQEFDKVICHNASIVEKYVKCFGEDVRNKVVYYPMPVQRVMDDSMRGSKDPNVLNIGLFGFCYYHKGVDRLITTLRNILLKRGGDAPVKLYIYSSKPAQDSMNYFEQCVDLVRIYGLANFVEWNASYLAINDLLTRLNGLDILCLPYDDYGSIGASAALSTAIQAEGPQIICSEDSPYFDVDDTYTPNILTLPNSRLEQHLTDVLDVFEKNNVKPVTNTAAWNKCFCERSWQSFAVHLNSIYEELLRG